MNSKLFPNKPIDKRLVYLDHAATTYLDLEVKKAMDPYFSDIFANPSGLYAIGREASSALLDARTRVTKIFGSHPDTIIFTGSGTESDNMAIQGLAFANKDNGKHIITTKIEHYAVLKTCEYLEKSGFEVTYLPVDKSGQINLKDFKKALRTDTILVSIMYANNEIGTVLPVSEIGREILKWRKTNNTLYPYFHSDACQATGALDLNVERLHADLITINGSKIYGPKGVGVLYKRRGVKLQPIIHGGGQEMGLRSGTENIPSIVGLAKALELVQKDKEKENKRLIEIRNYFWEEVNKKITKVELNGPELGDESVRLPNNLNVSILDVEGEALLLYLDEYGIICSTGSACTSESLDPSHVLLACGLPYEYAHGSLRFSFGKKNTKDDVDYVMKYLPAIVERLRELSPVHLGEKKHAKYIQR